MRKFIKTIILAFLPILCSSCVGSSNCLNYDDFDDFYFTKWIRNDGEFCYFAEGSGRPHYGFGYYENDKTRYRVNMITMLSNFAIRIRGNDVDEEYALTKS